MEVPEDFKRANVSIFKNGRKDDPGTLGVRYFPYLEKRVQIIQKSICKL